MNIEQRLRENLIAEDPGREFTAGVLARVKRRRRGRGRFILGGTVLMVVAAAAMLGLHPTIPPTHSVAASSGAAEAVRILGSPTVGDTTGPDSADESGRKTAASQDAIPKAFTVQVLPLRGGTDDPVVRRLAQQHYDKLIEELRAVPGLVLISPEQDAEAAQGDFRIIGSSKQAPSTLLKSAGGCR